MNNKKDDSYSEIETTDSNTENCTIDRVHYDKEKQIYIDELKKSAKSLQIQSNLLLSIGQLTSLSDILIQCLDSAIEISELDCGGIYLFDSDGGLELVQAKGLSDPFLKAVEYFSSHSENTCLVMGGEPAYMCYSDAKLPFKKVDVDENLKALAIIPIFHNRKAIGCLNLASRVIETIPQCTKVSIEAIAAVIGVLIGKTQVENNLRESEENYKQAEKMAKLGHWRRSFSSSISYWSGGTHEIFGTIPEEFIPTKENFYKTIHPLDLPMVKAAIDESIKNKEPLDIEYRAIRPDGSIITVHSHAELKDDMKVNDLLIGTIQDITKYKAIEQELKRQTSRLEELNTAMKILIEHRENELEELKRNLLENINKLVVPYLEKANSQIQTHEIKIFLDIAISNLENITKPFVRTLSANRLSPTELQVAGLIKNGKTTKEIASVMNVSNNTIMTHRYNIRRKLGLLKEKKNLYSYLQMLQQ